MTSLTILPNAEKKTLKFTGRIAVGEHVAVYVSGGADWIGEGKALRLRVLFCAKQVAMFPLVTAEDAAGDESGEIVADAWDAGGEGGADAICTLNLNTIPAEKYLKFGGNCLFILDDATNYTLHGMGELEVLPWPQREGADVPYNLDEYPDIVADLQDAWTAYQATVNTRLGNHEATVTAALALKAGADDLATEVAARGSGDAALGARVSAVESTTATHTSQISSLQTDVASKADATATSAALLALDATKADKADLDGFINAADYDSNAKKILLKHDVTTVAEIDATAFIKDGMVSSVAISSGKLVITFNTDAGLEPIEIPLTDIFNPANYYDKTATNTLLSGKADKVEGKGLSTEDFTTEDKQKLAGIAEGADVTPPPIAPSQNPDDTGKAADAYETGWRLSAKAEARSGTQGNIAVYAEYSTLLEDSGFKPSDFATHDDVALVASNVDTAQATADYAQSSADDAFTKADEALSTANNARSAADEAKSTADTAKTTADNAYAVAKRVETDVNFLSKDVHEARTVADEAKSSAEGASSIASTAVDESRKAWSAASEAKELAQTAKSEVATKIYYTTAAQSVASDTIALSERTFNVLDATAYGDTNTVMVALPAEPTAESGKVADVLLRVDTGATVPTLDFDETANTFIAADDSWATLEASSHNVFSFTSAGLTRTSGGAKRVWVVGRVTAALETGGV